MMYDENSLWWMLQLQLPARNEDQRQLFTSPISRPDLISKSFSLIPRSIRIHKGNCLWGFADLNKYTGDLYTFKLTVRPPNTSIAEEPEPGHLKETKDPRFYTLSLIHIPKQIIFVHRSPYVSRYARSANTFASIYMELLKKAVDSLNMRGHYDVEVEPIAQIGSFVEWVKSIDVLKKILIRHTGPNLPTGASNLIATIRESANRYKKALHSKDVEMIANNPKLEKEEVEELDEAAADRRLKLKARGIKSGIGTSWSSKTKPVPETAIMPINEDQLEDTKLVAQRISAYIDDRFDRG